MTKASCGLLRPLLLAVPIVCGAAPFVAAQDGIALTGPVAVETAARVHRVEGRLEYSFRVIGVVDLRRPR